MGEWGSGFLLLSLSSTKMSEWQNVKALSPPSPHPLNPLYTDDSQLSTLEAECHKMQHMTRVYNVCVDKKDLQRKKYNFILLYPVIPQYKQCTIPCLLY